MDSIDSIPPSLPCPATTFNTWVPLRIEQMLEQEPSWVEHTAGMALFHRLLASLSGDDETITEYLAKWAG
jgi:hypothetical protein